MAKIVIEYPDELTDITIEAFCGLYGGQHLTDPEERRRFCHWAIFQIVSQEVAKYIRERALVPAVVLANDRAEQLLASTTGKVTVSSEVDTPSP